MEARITAILSAKVDAFVSGINQAASRLQKFGQDADRIGVALSVAVSAPLALLGRTAIKTAGEFDAMERGLASLEKNATTLEARLKTLTAIANLPGGLGFKDAVAGDIRLRTVLNSIYGVEKAASLSERTLKGFSNAAALVGKGSAEINRALYGVQQLANTEFPLGEDLNIIKDALPQVSAILNEAFGTSRTEQLQKMKISSQQVFEAILTGLEKLPAGTIGITTTFEQIQQAIDQRLAKIGKSLFKVFDIGGAADKLLSIVDSLIAKFDALSPIAQKIVASLGLILIAVPPIIAAVGLLAPAVTAGIAAFKALGVAVSAFSVASGVALGPLALIAAAVVATAAVIITHWDKVKATLAESGIWDLMKDMIGSALSVITSIFGVFANLIQGDWKNLWQHLVDILKAFWNFGISITQAGVRFIGNAFGGLLDLLGAPSNGKKVKEFYQGLADTMNSIQFDLPASPTGNLFEGFNFYNGSNDPTKKKTQDAAQQAAAKKALDDYVKAQSEASKSIVDSLQRTRDISISLIKDETERKRAELKAQASDRRAQAEIEVQDETVKAREIKAINEKLAADLAALNEIKPIKSTARGVSTFQAFGNAGLKPLGNPIEAQKDILGKTDKLPGLDGFLAKLDKFNEKLKEKSEKSIQLAQNLGNSLQGAVQDMAVGVADAFAQMASGTGGLEGFARNLLSLLGNVISNLGKASIAAGVAALSLKAVFATPAAAIAAGTAAVVVGGLITAAASNVQSKFSGPRLAKGGEVFGPTIAMVGDNRNAHIDPELVGPSSTFRKMMREELVGGGRTVHVIGEIRNDRIILANSRGQNERNTLRGK